MAPAERARWSRDGTIASTIESLSTGRPVLLATPAPATAPAPALAPRDIFAVTAALGQLDQAVASAEQAAAIDVPGKGVFGGNRDAHEAAVAERVKLLAPAAATIKGAIDVLNANAGYRSQPGDPFDQRQYGGYTPKFKPLGDNAHDIVSISTVAAANPVKFKWANDFPWQDAPTTSLVDMVDIMQDQAGVITRGEAMISLRRVSSLTADLLYAQRAQELDAPKLQQLQDAVAAVRSLGSSRFADDRLRAALEVLPASVLVDGKLTTDPAALAALEQLHRSTVTDIGSARANAIVAQQLQQAAELAAAGNTTGAREIYERIGAAG
jgi:hypothetical protein